MRWLKSITRSVDTNLTKLWVIVENWRIELGSETWHAALHAAQEWDVTNQQQQKPSTKPISQVPGLNLTSATYGEGNGNLLQYSCLENPMDGEAWQATVYGVTKSLKQLSDFTSLLQLRPCVTLASYLTSLCLHLSIYKGISSTCFPDCSEGEWTLGEKAPRTAPAVKCEGIPNTAERTHHSSNNVAEKLRP